MNGFIIDGEDLSVWVQSAVGFQMITIETATELARLVLKDNNPPTVYERQLPLIAEDGGDHWVVHGSAPLRPIRQQMSEIGQGLGRFEIHIDKRNARITKLIFA